MWQLSSNAKWRALERARKARHIFQNCWYGRSDLVGAIGFEPTTPCAQGRCATRLRYAPTVMIIDEMLIDEEVLPNESAAIEFAKNAPSREVSFTGGRIQNLRITLLTDFRS